MRTDCLLKVRWQQRMLRPDVKENMSPQEQQVGDRCWLLSGSKPCWALCAAAALSAEVRVSMPQHSTALSRVGRWCPAVLRHLCSLACACGSRHDAGSSLSADLTQLLTNPSTMSARQLLLRNVHVTAAAADVSARPVLCP